MQEILLVYDSKCKVILIVIQMEQESKQFRDYSKTNFWMPRTPSKGTTTIRKNYFTSQSKWKFSHNWNSIIMGNFLLYKAPKISFKLTFTGNFLPLNLLSIWDRIAIMLYFFGFLTMDASREVSFSIFTNCVFLCFYKTINFRVHLITISTFQPSILSFSCSLF